MTVLAARFICLRASRALWVSRPAAAFHTSPLRAALNESDRGRPDVAEEIELNKQEALSKAKDGKGEWKPELASNSEQVVRHEGHNMSIEEMQKEAVQKAKEREIPKQAGKVAGIWGDGALMAG